MHLLFLFISFGLVLSVPLDWQWEEWKLKHGKSYKDEADENHRKNEWTRNYHYILQHNRQDHLFKLGLNEFADMTQEEFAAMYHRPMDVESITWGATRTHVRQWNVTYPSSMDWRNMGFVTGVKKQGHCGSSWAFSATGALEGQYYRATRRLVSLSEQQFLDCSEGFGNQGCDGGLSTNAFRYVQSNGGICAESQYTYLGYAWYCADRYCTKLVSCSGFVKIESGSEADLLDATSSIGPIRTRGYQLNPLLTSVVVDSRDITFQYYNRGIYCNSKCSKRKPNHAMLVVGYGSDNGVDYWILKNSWGQYWGDGGYMKMVRGMNNTCGIATAASYPIVYRN